MVSMKMRRTSEERRRRKTVARIAVDTKRWIRVGEEGG